MTSAQGTELQLAFHYLIIPKESNYWYQIGYRSSKTGEEI
jgi:hypothetical protein